MGNFRNGSGLSGRATRYVTGDAGVSGVQRVMVADDLAPRLQKTLRFCSRSKSERLYASFIATQYTGLFWLMNSDLFTALFSVTLDGIALAVVGCTKRDQFGLVDPDQVDKAEDLQVISYNKSCAFLFSFQLLLRGEHAYSQQGHLDEL